MNRPSLRTGLPAIVLAAAALLARPAAADAVDWVEHRTDHFVVRYQAADVAGGANTAERMKLAGELFELAHDTFTKEMGLPAPAGTELGPDGKKRTAVYVYDWAKLNVPPFGGDRAHQMAEEKDGVIRLRVGRWGRRDAEHPLLVSEAAHEVFHAVQREYVAKPHARYDWFREGTAEWAVAAAYPELRTREFLVWEHRFLLFPHLPIDHHDQTDGTVAAGVRSTGHPYGTLALFRFLGLHHAPAPAGKLSPAAATTARNAALLRTMLEGWKAEAAADPAGYHPLNVVAKAVGTTGPNDPKFRAAYDAFAVACALGPKASGVPHLADATSLRFGAAPTRTGWAEQYPGSVRSVSGTIHTVPPEEKLFPAREPIDPPFRAEWGGTTVGRGGFRVYRIEKPAGTDATSKLPKDATLSLAVQADPDHVSVQAVVRPGPGQPVKVIPASYDPAQFRHLVRVPKFDAIADVGEKDESRAAVLLVVTRYSSGAPKGYMVTITVAEPPVLTGVKITQKGAPRYHVTWDPTAGTLTSRARTAHAEAKLDPARDEAAVELTFNNPVLNPFLESLCTFNGKDVTMKPVGDGRVWRGAIPADWVVTSRQELRIRAENNADGGRGDNLPLDTVPETVAAPSGDHWDGYERDDKGMVIRLGPPGQLGGEIALAVSRHPNGHSTVLDVRHPVLADIRAGKAGGRVRITVYRSCSPTGPFEETTVYAGIYTGATWRVTQTDNPENGWHPTAAGTFRLVDANGQYGKRVPNPKTGQRDWVDGGPVYYLVSLRPVDADGNPDGNELRSPVVAPAKPAIHILNPRKGGGADINLSGTCRGLVVSVGPANQAYSARGVRVKVTYSGPLVPEQTRYAFTRLSGRLEPRLDGYGPNYAFVPLPVCPGPLSRVRVEADHPDGPAAVTAELYESPDYWTEVRARRAAGKERIEKEFTGVLAEARAAVARAKAAKGPTPADEQKRVKQAENNLKRVEARRVWKLAEQGQDAPAALAALTTYLDLGQEAIEAALKSNEPDRARDFSWELVQLYGDLARLALTTGDRDAFRRAAEGKLVALTRQRAERGWGNEFGHEPHTSRDNALEFLAHNLVLLGGDVAEAKRLYLEARGLRWERSSKFGREIMDNQWKKGERPDWWPGD